MKKALAMTLLLLFAFSLVAAVAETWTCPQCGGSSEGNFCPYCGAKKPEQGITCTGCGAVYSQDVEYTFCPNCGTALRGAAQSGMDLSGINAGDTLTFGHYEQDGNAGNGAEEIEWIVLANDGGRCVMVSKYALDSKPYNTEQVNTTWETCTLRKWLNGDFLNAAFSAKEQAMLETVTVTADKNPKYGTNPGNDTRDKVFLLSVGEATRYFASSMKRICYSTAYTKAQGALTNSDGFCGWWLRSPGLRGKYAATIHSGGSVSYDGHYVDYSRGGIRPVVVLRERYGEESLSPDGGTALSVAPGDIKAGDTLTFGRYDQDDNADNGAEGIEWIVLANDGGRCVMMSKYGLDAVYYNTEEVDVTWETCTLRRWLNGDFLNAAFTAEERAMLETVTVTADPNPQFDTDPGNDTRDKVFLLSIDELARYAVSDEVLMCAPTRTAVANGVCVMEDDYEIDDIRPDDDYENATCWWWLRSPGAYPCYAADVYYLGSVTIDCWGALVDNEGSVDGSGCYTGPGALRPVVVLGL